MSLLRHILSRAVASVNSLLLLSAAALTSCGEKDIKAEGLAGVGDKTLTASEVAAAIPVGLSTADSTRMAENYIDQWIINELLGEVAEKNIANLDEINRMAEEYRRNLIIDEYRRLKLAQDTSLAITQQQIEDFYANYGGEMRLEEPMIRGIFIAISASSPQLSGIRRWYMSSKEDDIEKLEKVGLTEAVNYEYFRDRWVPLSAIAGRFPAPAPQVSRKGQNIETSDDNTIYLLSVSDYLPAGASMPLSSAEPEIRRRLETARRTRIDARLKQQLYDDAIEKGKAWKK
ncbi:MAG: hypothetical protein K2K82_00540 [Muribaculaceae bacterium]|nr:hypothetical protein [Muribaculaceae bacterium]